MSPKLPVLSGDDDLGDLHVRHLGLPIRQRQIGCMQKGTLWTVAATRAKGDPLLHIWYNSANGLLRCYVGNEGSPQSGCVLFLSFRWRMMAPLG